mgnify:CR=1 FL=1
MSSSSPPGARSTDLLAAGRDQVAHAMRYTTLLWVPVALVDYGVGTHNGRTLIGQLVFVVGVVVFSFVMARLSERSLDLLLSFIAVGSAVTVAWLAYTWASTFSSALAVLFALPLLSFAVFGNRRLPTVTAGFAATAATLWLITRHDAGAAELARWGTMFAVSAVYLGYGFSRLGHASRLERTQIEHEYRFLIEALAEGALVRARSELEVLSSAGRLLRRAELDAAFLKVDGEVMRMTSANYVVRGITRPLLELVQGRLRDITLRLDALPWLQQLFELRRAAIRPDISEQLRAALPRSIFTTVFTMLPTHGGVDVPLFVDDRPWGVMTVRGKRLSPATVAALELFAHQLEIAFENVELHERRRRQLEAMTELKRELLEQQRLAGLGEAAAVMAHEVRNPLGVIQNAVSLLHRQLPAGAQAAGVLSMIDEEVNHLDVLVSKLLQVARPLELKLELLELGALLERCAVAARNTPACAHVTIEVVRPAAPVFARADVTQLEIAVGNLLLNAGQASPANASVRMDLELRGDSVCLRVDDSGPGVLVDLREKIFQPFFTTRAKGTGLGLTIVRQVVRSLGGDVQVGDAPGGGARFELLLARQQPA